MTEDRGGKKEKKSTSEVVTRAGELLGGLRCTREGRAGGRGCHALRGGEADDGEAAGSGVGWWVGEGGGEEGPVWGRVWFGQHWDWDKMGASHRPGIYI